MCHAWKKQIERRIDNELGGKTNETQTHSQGPIKDAMPDEAAAACTVKEMWNMISSLIRH